jgi:hypothetical protein
MTDPTVRRVSKVLEFVPPCTCLRCGASIPVTRDLKFREDEVVQVDIVLSFICDGCCEKEAAA